MTFLEVLGVAFLLTIVVLTTLCWPLVRFGLIVLWNKLRGKSWDS